MKKTNILLIISIMLGTLLTATSCREEADYFRNSNDYLNNVGAGSKLQATKQFENVWSAINTGYAFWDITDIDWDARYEEMKPKFEAFDAKMDTLDMSHFTKEDITALQDEYHNLYVDLVTGLKDGHMAVRVAYYMDGYTLTSGDYVRPSYIFNADRMHNDNYATIFRGEFLKNLGNDPHVSQFDSCYFDCNGSRAGHTSCVYTLNNGKKVPYLWLASFMNDASIQKFIDEAKDSTTETIQTAKKWKPIYDNYIDNLINTPKSELAGVIIDVRCNGGGNMAALKNYINIFTSADKAYWETRYKEGMGRYDMSAWAPSLLGMPEKHRDMAAEDIPIVVLCDVNSVSCAEFTPGSIKQLPTSYLIGERTWGGHGPLLGQTNAYFNTTYGGVCGDINLETLGFFVYTSNYENHPVGSPVLESIGITPNEEVLFKDKGYQGQFDAAIRYLEAKSK